MKISARFLREAAQFCLLILFAAVAWQLLHRPPSIPRDVYPYLSSISPELVKQCYNEYNTSTAISFWEDLLAIRSSLTATEAQPFLDQLKRQVTFADLNWGHLPVKTVKTIQRHREILKQFPYYRPNQYVFPVPGETWFEDSFGANREGGKRKHKGTDLFGQEGTPIISSCGGRVEQLGWNRLGGERVGIRGDDGNYYYYAHLERIAGSLAKGRRIKAGEAIGTMGHSGDALTTPDHLHFGIELSNGQWINPYPFLAAWQYWRK